MYKKIIALFFLVVFVSVPLESVSAQETEEYTVLGQQLLAIASYLEREFDFQNAEPLENEQIREIVSNGVNWMKESQEENGHFAYEYTPYEDIYLDDDHIVRQAGSLYELGEIARRDKEDTLDTSRTIEKSLEYLWDLSQEGTYRGSMFRCIVDSQTSRRCQLGATSLAFIGLLGFLEQKPEKIPQYEKLLESYLSFILQSQKKNGGFKNTYRFNKNFQSEKESSFSNGEALLALVRYYQFKETEKVKEAIDIAFAYLKDTEFDSASYLWMMAALKDMHTLWKDDEYISYGKAYTNWRLSRMRQLHGTNKNFCASTEGLTSAYSLLEDENMEELRTEIDFWNTKNSYLQITKNDQFRIILSTDGLSMKFLKNPTQALGGFLTSESVLTQRIDYTQHCVSAYVQMLIDIEGEVFE